MGSFAPDEGARFHTSASGMPVVGSYNPDTGRLAWSQASPQHEGISWEVWGQLYASTSGGEEGTVADRILASWQDTEGRRGNCELPASFHAAISLLHGLTRNYPP